jgi:hypothetical protein
MSLRFVERHAEAHESPPVFWTREGQRATDQFGTLAHRYEPQASTRRSAAEASPVILDLELQHLSKITQPDPHAIRPGMPGHVAQGFLEHAIDMDSHGGIDRDRRASALERHG